MSKHDKKNGSWSDIGYDGCYIDDNIDLYKFINKRISANGILFKLYMIDRSKAYTICTYYSDHLLFYWEMENDTYVKHKYFTLHKIYRKYWFKKRGHLKIDRLLKLSILRSKEIKY